MKIFSLLLIVAFVSAGIVSCNCIDGNRDVVNKSTEIGTFSKIKVSIPAEVELVNDSGSTVHIQGESNIIDLCQIDESDGTLRIYSDECFNNHETIRLKIPVKGTNLSKIDLSGSGNITSADSIRCDDVELVLNGSGDIRIIGAFGKVAGKLNGSGRIEIIGKADNGDFVINGSGNIDANECQAGNVGAAINGSGNCNVFAINRLEAKITGSGDINYKGSPSVNSKILGSGSVEKRD